MAETFARFDTLDTAFDPFAGQGPFMRSLSLSQIRSADLRAGGMAGVPAGRALKLAGVVFAGVGFCRGGFGLGVLMRLLRGPFVDRRPPHRAQGPLRPFLICPPRKDCD